MDSQQLWNAALTLGMAVIGGFIALGSKHLAQIQKSLEDRMQAHDDTLEQTKEDLKDEFCRLEQKVSLVQLDLNDFKIFAHRDFVQKEDYIRTTQQLNSKLDRVLEGVGETKISVAKLATAMEVKGN